MKTIPVNSKRIYLIQGFEDGTPISVKYSLNDIMGTDDGSELLYTLQDQIDDLLDMEVGKSYPTTASRDNKSGDNVIIILRKI